MRMERLLRILVPVTGLALAAGCGSSDEQGNPPANTEREEGQTDFSSAPPASQGGGGRSFGGSSSGGAESANAGAPAPAADSAQQGGAGGAQREVKETDLYRVDGDRLYYLNSYRGLMVFDISNVDDPKLLGRSAVFGTPVEMYVSSGIATVVVGDWYGTSADGSPFHGSVVRTINAQDPANIKVAGEVQVKGWARDMRVVGSNLYIVSEDYGWYYGMWYGGYYYGGGDVAVAPGGGYYGGGYNSKVVISSVTLGGGAPTLAGEKIYDGYSGAFNVTENTIMLAHDIVDPSTKQPTGKASLEYINITNPSGAIEPKGSFEVDGLLQGWSADNGRWNVNLAGNTAEVITCAASQYNYCNGNEGYNLTTVDFTDPNAPKLQGKLAIPGKGWAATARFSDNRMYLSPREGAYSSNGTQQPTPLEVYDLSDKTAPKLAGSTTLNGAVWLFMPMGTDRLFALGNEYGQNGQGYYSSSQVSLRYLDVADATNPKLIGTSTFGDGWAWSPAAGTFKAFVRDDAQKLVALPFSGWNYNSYEYQNGVQLIEYDTNAITTRGASKSKGWVERGIFVKNRVISLSDQALTVVDHTDRNAPKVVREITLARNVIAAQPQGSTIAQLSTDWWGYDQSKSELRVLPIANAEETKFDAAAKSVSVDGTNARLFRNGDLAYVITTLYPKNPNGPYYATPRVQVVDLSNGDAKLRGSVELPQEQNYYWGWWGGCYYWDWYDGSNVVQVGKDVLAFRRVFGSYDQATGQYTAETKLYVVDLANADAPKLASTTITNDPDYWWGNVRVVGDTLYTTHYEWIQKPNPNGNGSWSNYWVKYYLDQIDLSDRNNPKVGKRINVPGILVGNDENDPSLLYFIDYRWWGTQNKDELAVAKIVNDKAYLKSTTLLDGWVGQTIVRGSKAYMSTQEYFDPQNGQPGKSTVKLNEIDLKDPKFPVIKSSTAKDGWGWLLDVEGDRAIITSGWGQVGLDIYKLDANAPPKFDQFARTRGWWPNAITRQDGNLYVSTGYWGVQKITLK